MSHYDATGDMSQISSLYAKVTKYLFYFTASVCALLLIFGDNFIYLWMGPEFTKTVHVLYILVIPSAIYLPQIAANSVMLGIGKHRPLFYILISEALFNLVLSLALVRPLGIYGVALGTAVTQLLIYTYIFPYVFHRVIRGDLKLFYGYILKTVSMSLIIAVPIGLTVDRFNPLSGWVGLIAGLIITGLPLIWGFWRGVLYAEDKTKLKAKLWRKR